MTAFGIREISARYWEVTAETRAGRCYYLGMAPSDEVQSAAGVTVALARQWWKESRRDWVPDYSGGAGSRPLEVASGES